MHCLCCRWITARRLDDGAEPPRWVMRHHARCPACRAQQERHRRLIARLEADAGGSRVEPPLLLHARILANLDSPCVTADRSGSPRALGWAVAFAGLGAVSLLVALWPGTGPRRIAVPGAGPDTVPAGQSVFAGLAGFPGRETVLSFGTNMGAPLEGEMQLVMDDARSALTALSRNFVPADFAGVTAK